MKLRIKIVGFSTKFALSFMFAGFMGVIFSIAEATKLGSILHVRIPMELTIFDETVKLMLKKIQNSRVSPVMFDFDIEKSSTLNLVAP